MREHIEITGDPISIKEALYQISEIVKNIKSNQAELTDWSVHHTINKLIATYLGWKHYQMTAWTNEDSEYTEWVDPHGVMAGLPSWSSEISHAILLYPKSVPTKIYSDPLYIVLDALRERYYAIKD